MSEEVKILFRFLSGGAAGSLITWFATYRREKANRLRIFRQDVAELRARIDDTKDEDLIALSLSTRDAVRIMCARIRNDIYGGVIQKFESACAEYCDVERNEREAFHSRLMHVQLYDSPLPAMCERGRKQIMDEALLALSECAT